MNSISEELLNASNIIKSKTYFYNVLLYFINNTKYDNKLLIDYCKFVENYNDYNENEQHTLYDTNINKFIRSFDNCSEEEKVKLNYYNQLDNMYNMVIKFHTDIPMNLYKNYNVPKNVYKVIYFIIDQNNYDLARKLSIMLFMNK